MKCAQLDYLWLYGEKYSQSTDGYPILSITFRSNKGLESYWSYTDISAGRAGTASICEFSGNLVFTHGDTTTPGSRAPASIYHVFNNYMAGEGFGTVMPYRGHGWMLSCQQQLLPSSKANISMVTPMTPTEILLRFRAATRPQRRHTPNSSSSLMTN